MRFLYRKTNMSTDVYEAYLQEVDGTMGQCLKLGQYVVGRVADVLVPNEPAIIKLAELKGSPDFTNEFENAAPFGGHLKRMTQECWTDVQRRFHERCQLEIGDSPRRGWRLMRQILVFGPKPHFPLLGVGHPEPQNRLNKAPNRLRVSRGGQDLGVLTEYLRGDPKSATGYNRYYVGELHAGPEQHLVFSTEHGLAEAIHIPIQAHIAALDLLEHGSSYQSLGREFDRVNDDRRISAIIKTYIAEHQAEFLPGDPMSLATLAGYDLKDWRELTIEVLETQMPA